MAEEKRQSWPADQPERRKLSQLKPFERNARLHSPEQVRQLRAAIEAWGWTMPVLIDERDIIIAGHGRVLAAQLDPPITEVPVLVARGWTDEQQRAYVIADNKLTLNASWDDELLRLEIGDLKELGADLGLVGFSDGDLAQLFLEQQDGETDPNAEWQGMPHYASAGEDGLKCIVHFADEADRAAFEKLLDQHIPKQTNAIWYPYRPPENMKAKQWRTDDGGDPSDTALSAVHPEQGPQSVHDDEPGPDADGSSPQHRGRAAGGRRLPAGRGRQAAAD